MKQMYFTVEGLAYSRMELGKAKGRVSQSGQTQVPAKVWSLGVLSVHVPKYVLASSLNSYRVSAHVLTKNIRDVCVLA